jgi:ribosomal protein S19E (S16A)
MTTRDDVWDTVAHELKNRGKFKISELPFEEEQRHTVRRVLKEMEDIGWVRRTSEQAAIWRLGPVAETLLEVDEEVVARARDDS